MKTLNFLKPFYAKFYENVSGTKTEKIALIVLATIVILSLTTALFIAIYSILTGNYHDTSL